MIQIGDLVRERPNAPKRTDRVFRVAALQKNRAQSELRLEPIGPGYAVRRVSRHALIVGYEVVHV